MADNQTTEPKNSLLRYYGSVEYLRGEVARVQALGGTQVAVPKIELSFPLRAFGDVSLYLSREEATELRRHLGQALEAISNDW